MLHTIMQWSECVHIVHDNGGLLICPDLHNKQQIERLQDKVTAIFSPYVCDPNDFSVYWPNVPVYFHNDVLAGGLVDIFRIQSYAIDGVGFDYIISTGSTRIYYQHVSYVPGNWYADIVSQQLPIDLGLFRLQEGLDNALHIAQELHARTVVPLHATSDQLAIDYCRNIMLYNSGVPKYLKPGQYVVHGV